MVIPDATVYPVARASWAIKVSVALTGPMGAKVPVVTPAVMALTDAMDLLAVLAPRVSWVVVVLAVIVVRLALTVLLAVTANVVTLDDLVLRASLAQTDATARPACLGATVKTALTEPTDRLGSLATRAPRATVVLMVAMAVRV